MPASLGQLLRNISSLFHPSPRTRKKPRPGVPERGFLLYRPFDRLPCPCHRRDDDHVACTELAEVDAACDRTSLLVESVPYRAVRAGTTCSDRQHPDDISLRVVD